MSMPNILFSICLRNSVRFLHSLLSHVLPIILYSPFYGPGVLQPILGRDLETMSCPDPTMYLALVPESNIARR